MTLEDVAAELYGLDPGEFIEARDARARAARDAGDRALAIQIGGLRRPAVAAWAINLLVRDAPAEVDRLLDLGAALNDAQRRLSGDRLRDLTAQRRRAVNTLADKAGRVAAGHGRPLSTPVLREIGETLNAALADPAVAERVRTWTTASPPCAANSTTPNSSGASPHPPSAPPASPCARPNSASPTPGAEPRGLPRLLATSAGRRCRETWRSACSSRGQDSRRSGRGGIDVLDHRSQDRDSCCRTGAIGAHHDGLSEPSRSPVSVAAGWRPLLTRSLHRPLRLRCNSVTAGRAAVRRHGRGSPAMPRHALPGNAIRGRWRVRWS